MPFGNIWTCDQCGYSVRTAGYFKFYIDKNGNRKRCGHPIPSASDKKAAGYSKEGFCPHCKETKDVVVATFAVPQNSEGEYKEVPAICNVCHATLKDNLEGEICPKCNVGHFKESGRFMS
jgi:rubrerythrin